MRMDHMDREISKPETEQPESMKAGVKGEYAKDEWRGKAHEFLDRFLPGDKMKTEGGEGDKADDKRVITESDESTSSKEGERYDGSGRFQRFSEKMVAAADFISIASGVLSAGLEARETPNTVPMKDASFQTSVVSYESPNNSNALDQLISKHGIKLENGEGENSKKEGDGEDKNSKSENTLIDMGQWIEAMGSDNWEIWRVRLKIVRMN